MVRQLIQEFCASGSVFDRKFHKTLMVESPQGERIGSAGQRIGQLFGTQ
jgi:hypothetical protein